MKKYGKVKLVFEAIEPAGFGNKTEKVLNIYTDDSTLPMVYVNVEVDRAEETYDNGASWNTVSMTTESKYDTYIGKTVDEILNLYKTNPYFDTVTWLNPLSEIA